MTTKRPAASQASLASKLQLKEGQRILVFNAPEGYPAALEPLPEGASVSTAADDAFDAVLLFASTKAEVDRNAAGALKALAPGGLLWACYPKRTATGSRATPELNRDRGWDALWAADFIAVRQVALDDTWSALRFRHTSETSRQSLPHEKAAR